MAKSRNFFGLRRGSTKNFTFQVQKGQQITKDRVLDVTNPRTNGQMMHRSLFANVIKFYKHGQQAFFKFAFEDKKPFESDYNAFVRHNIERSTRISKQASKSEMYPAIAPWQLTQGSLIEPSVVHSGSNIWRIAVAGLTSNVTTWSALQDVLISAFGLQNGDILTFVNIIAIGATEVNMPSVDNFGGLVGNRWNIEQLQLGVATEGDALPSFMKCENGEIILDFANVSTDAYAQAVAFVISRKTPSGLKVSTSYLVANTAAEAIIAKSNESRYIDEVLTSWSTSDEAILEGALVSKSAQEETNMVKAIIPSLPNEAGSISVSFKKPTSESVSPATGEDVGTAIVNGQTYNVLVKANQQYTIELVLDSMQGSVEAEIYKGDDYTIINNPDGKTISAFTLNEKLF